MVIARKGYPGGVVAVAVVAGAGAGWGGAPGGAMPMRRVPQRSAHSYVMVGHADQLVTNAEAATVVGGNASSIHRQRQMQGSVVFLQGPRGKLMVFVLPSAYFTDTVHGQPRSFRPVAGIGDKALLRLDGSELLVLQHGVTIKFDLWGIPEPVSASTLNALKTLGRKAAGRVPASWSVQARQAAVAARPRRPETAVAGVAASALVTPADAATLLGSQPVSGSMPGRGGSNNMCVYNTPGGGSLIVLVHPSSLAAMAAHRPNPDYTFETPPRIGDKAILYVSKRARAEGRTDIQLFVLKGNVQLDLMLRTFSPSAYPTTPNAVKAVGRKAIARAR